MAKAKLLLQTGDKIGNCTYLREAGFQLTNKGLKNRVCTFLCKCGSEFTTFIGNVQRGNTSSCGCLKKEMAGSHNLTHGLSRISNKMATGYNAYLKMVSRCTNKNNAQYAIYSKRGICESWLSSFENFINDMGIRPSLKHSIERIDNSKGYYKENCKWATKIEQANNTSTNLFVEYRGQRNSFAKWCLLLGIKYRSSYLRYTRYNKSFEQVVAAGIVEKLKTSRVTLNV